MLTTLSNATYDGDEMNLTLILDLLSQTYAERLSPAHYVRSTKQPRRVTSDISLPTPIVETTVNWLFDKDYLDKIGYVEKE